MAVQLGPEQELRAAFLALLGADADIKSLIGDPARIYEDVPEADYILPYVTIGESQNVADTAECIDGSICYIDIHVWSELQTFDECDSITSTIWAVLAAATVVLTQNRCVDFFRQTTHTLRDPDGITKHAVLTVKVLTEPA